jgi:outer membrane protein TolC
MNIFKQNNQFIFFSLALLGMLSNHAAFAQTLTLDQALKDARHDSLELQVSDAEKDQAEWGTTEARAAFLPQISADATHYFDIKYQTLFINFAGLQTNFAFVTPATTYGLTASWNVFNGFQDYDRLGAAKLKSQASRKDLEYARFQVDQEVKLNFFEVIAARLLESAANENVTNLETHLKQIQDMLKAGEAIEVDVLRVQVQLNNARSQKINAHDSVIISQQKLAQALGKTTESRQPEGDLPIPDSDISKRIQTTNRDEQRKFADRLDLQASDLRSEAAEKAENASTHYWIPSLSLVGNYQYYNNNDFNPTENSAFKSSYEWGLELKWNIFDGLLSYARAKEAADETIREVKSTALARIQAATDVQTNESDYQFQLSQFVANTDNLDRSKRSVQLALSGLRSGTQTNTDVLDAELDLFNARAGVIQSQIKALEAQVKFENAIGRTL